jgi:hypothetical protein
MTATDIFLLFLPLAGLLLIAAFVWWQNERDASLPRRKK